MHAAIQHMNVTPDFYQFFWLYYVRDVDLSKHCMNTFRGTRSKEISPKVLFYNHVQLDESDESILYLCGVARQSRTKSDKEKNNFHLAMRVKKGSEIRLQHGGVKIEVKDAERLRIERVKDPPSSLGPKFTDCRNWQFANAFASPRGPLAWEPK